MHLSVYVYVAGNVGSCSGSMKVMHCCLVANKIYNHTKKHVDRKATRTLTGKMIEDMYMCMQSSMCVHFNVCVCAIRHGSACRCVFICFVCVDWLHVPMCIYICVYVSVWCMSSYMLTYDAMYVNVCPWSVLHTL